MLVKVIKDFNDRTADLVTRVVNDEFDVTEQRAEELIKGGYVEKVEEKEQDHKEDDLDLNQTPSEPDENLNDSVEEPTEDSAEETTPEFESKPEPNKSSKAKKNEKKD